MNKHIAERWVQALRSGQYQQGDGELHPDLDSYCCLGVLCDLYRVEQGKGEWCRTSTGDMEFRIEDDRVEESEMAVLPVTVAEWAGIRDVAGGIAETNDSLASMNDAGSTFPELADLIEKKWEVL